MRRITTTEAAARETLIATERRREASERLKSLAVEGCGFAARALEPDDFFDRIGGGAILARIRARTIFHKTGPCFGPSLFFAVS